MTRKKKNDATTPSTGSKGCEAALLDALRSNQNLLGELAARYEVSVRPEGPENPPTVNCSQDIYDILGPEMSALAQEQLRVLLLNIRNEVVAQRVIYQGNVNSSAVRAAEVLRPAVVEAAPAVIVVHNHPSGGPGPQSKFFPRRDDNAESQAGGGAVGHRAARPRGHRWETARQPQESRPDGDLDPTHA